MNHCHDCGAEFGEDSEVCPECGAQQPEAGDSENGSDRVVVGLLALFLGLFGAHKFYQGATRLGMMYLLVFWTGVPAILGIIEGIVILTTTDEVYERKYADGSIMGK